MGGRYPHSKGSEPKKSGKTIAPKSTSAQTKSSTSPSAVAALYGEVILDLVLHSTVVVPLDLLPLRGVSRAHCNAIDSKLFKHVRIVRRNNRQTCVVTPTGNKLLPGFRPVDYTALAQRGERTTNSVHLLNKATVIDVSSMKSAELLHLAPNLTEVHTMRLISSNAGLHIWWPPKIGKVSTMVVLPTFLPTTHGVPCPARKVPDNITKLVQYPTFVCDDIPNDGGMVDSFRSPVLFNMPGANVTKETWIFTHYEPKIPYSRFGLYSYNGAINDVIDVLRGELWTILPKRLQSGTIELTLVDHDPSLKNLVRACGLNIPKPDKAKAETMFRVALSLPQAGGCHLSKLRFMSWDEYAATLTEDERKAEAIPADYVNDMYTVPDNMYPPQCTICPLAHHDHQPCWFPDDD